MKEADLLAQVKDYLKIYHIFYCRIHQSFGCTKGIADILAIHPRTGRFMALELKGDKGKLSPEQGNFLRNVVDAGGLAGVIRSIEDLQKLLKKQPGDDTMNFLIKNSPDYLKQEYQGQARPDPPYAKVKFKKEEVKRGRKNS